MAWVIIVDGKSFSISSGIQDGYSEKDSIEKALAATTAAAKNDGLLIDAGFDDEQSILTVFVGKELYQSRNIYKGETVTVDKVDDSSIQADISEYAKIIHDELQSRKYEFEEKSGVVIYHFD